MHALAQPTWQLILRAAEHLDATAGYFSLAELIGQVQRFDPGRERTSISPVVQGMTANAGKGPSSPCGRPLVRISHGRYRLTGSDETLVPISNLIVKSTPQAAQLGAPLKMKVDTKTDSESLDRGYLEFQEGQKGVSFDYLFGPYVRGAHLVTVIDPYIRLFHQAKNMMEFIETARKFNSDDSDISVKLITIEDEDSEKAAKQRDLLNQVKTSANAAGIPFTYEFDQSRILHDREVTIDSGWRIVLGRGLDIFQYISNDAFEMANRIQSLRKVKKFGVSYLQPPTIRTSRPVVTLLGSQTSQAKGKPVVVVHDDDKFAAGDIVLVGCVKTKLHHAAAAKDLFISALFRKERAYAEASGVPWYILSAENGLVAPDQWLDPYERYLPKQSAKYRRDWGDKVMAILEQLEGPLQGKVIEIHAGAAYIDSIRSGLHSCGAIISEPLRDLRFGERLRWYGSGTLARQSDVRQFTGDPAPDIDSLVALLREESLALSPTKFIEAGSAGRKLPGMYSWWVDSDGALELTAGLGYSVPKGLIYVGLAGATQWPSGKPSSNTLWSRIENMHLGAKHEFSTLRRSIGAILANLEGREGIDEIALSRWIDLHLRVRVVPYRDADTLGRVELDILAELDPPLNIKGMPDSELRQQLKALRRKVVD